MRPFVDYVRHIRRFQRNARLYLLYNLLSGITTGILLVLYNLYLASLGYGADFVGLVLFVGTLGAGIAIFPAGLCIDRFSDKLILILSTLVIGTAGIGQILFRQPLPLLISSFLVGIGIAFTLVINAPFLTRNSMLEERPHLFSVNISLSLITLVIGEVLGGALPVWFRHVPSLMAPLPSWTSSLLAGAPEPRSYQLALLFAGIIAAPSFLPLFLLRPTRPDASTPDMAAREGQMPDEGEPDADAPDAHTPDAHQGRPYISASPTSSIGDEARMGGEAPTHVGTPLVGVRRMFALMGVRRIGIQPGMITPARLKKWLQTPFFTLALVYVLTGAGAGLFIPYFNLYFVQRLGASPALFGLIDGGANAMTALLTLAAPWLALRVGRLRAIMLTRLLSLPLLLTIGLTGSLPVAALLYLFRQGTMDMAAGILQVFSMEAVEERHRGVANSSYQAAFQVPWAITAPIGGLLIVHVGYPPIFLLGACCYFFTILVLWSRFRGAHV